ncbi:telomere repeats-binding bouquet formation protein 1-like isoform X2 [Camarhynchus parvulus]|uniref:telomere repeats-binding bouquet formation protein 1-like isoform X2 n=1 Tax=Geospiza parvula TaxID=87175 RepID=UPI001237EDCF|nr:telomere repeats-binding bouquet formation protein 1-like isoform X2 [Camarhynchus parvulus]
MMSEQLFKQPAETVRNMKQTCTSGQHSFCSEKTRRVKSISAISSSHKMADLRCLGCTAGGLSLNSKTFTKMLQRCLHRCEHHRVILEAEERYRGELRRVAASNNNRSATHQSMEFMFSTWNRCFRIAFKILNFCLFTSDCLTVLNSLIEFDLQ